jgi:hypothetical protein
MSPTRSIAALALAALLALPSAALAIGPPANPGHGQSPAATSSPTTNPITDPASTGPTASASAKAKAYGCLCHDESKKHVSRHKGTAFSRCVTAMAKAANGASAKAACATLSRRHKAGEKGTPYSRCVVAARDLAEQAVQPADA